LGCRDGVKATLAELGLELKARGWEQKLGWRMQPRG